MFDVFLCRVPAEAHANGGLGKLGATPIAASTCDFATLPDEQAEPEETAMPSRSKAISRVSANMPGWAKQVVLGSRSASLPKITASVKRFLKMVPQGFDIQMSFLRHGGKAGNAGEILGAGAAAQFLAAAMNERIKRQAVAHDKRAGAHWAAELVGGDGHQIDAEQAKIDRDLAEGLNRIGMNQAPVRMGKGHDLAQRLNDARLVVGEHHADQRLRACQAASPRPPDRQRLRRHGNEIDWLVRGLGGFEHRGMFNRGNHQALDRGALESQVVGLAAAAGEDHHAGQ